MPRPVSAWHPCWACWCQLNERRIKPVTHEVAEDQRFAAGVFDCEFVAVNHSIPDVLAVAVHTPAGTVLHTGDFKMDQLPLDGRITDLRAWASMPVHGEIRHRVANGALAVCTPITDTRVVRAAYYTMSQTTSGETASRRSGPSLLQPSAACCYGW